MKQEFGPQARPIRWMGRYTRESRADSVVEDHLAQKPRRNVGLHRLADYEAVVEECISDVADQWDERCKPYVISLELKMEWRAESGERRTDNGEQRTRSVDRTGILDT